jgi:hypothetical protein
MQQDDATSFLVKKLSEPIRIEDVHDLGFESQRPFVADQRWVPELTHPGHLFGCAMAFILEHGELFPQRDDLRMGVQRGA